MDDQLVSESTLAWLWVIEALASFKNVDLSLLHDLIEAAPDLPDDLGKNTKEFVALRCLEGVFASQDGMPTNAPSTQGLKVEFDLSASCEEVLQQILQETPVSDTRVGGLLSSKWDIHPFIRHKRACMPKCTLAQLKDSILDGTHPYADFLRERSGLVFKTLEDGISMNDKSRDSVTSRPNLTCNDAQYMRVEVNNDPLILGNRNKQLEENLQNGDILPSKRDRSGSTAEYVDGHFSVSCHSENNSVVEQMNVKKIKQHASAANHSVEHDPLPFCGREPLEDPFERDDPDTTRGHDLGEGEMGILEEGKILEDGRNENVTKRSQPSNDNTDLSTEPLESSSERDVPVIAEERMVLEDGCNESTVPRRSQQINDDEFYKNQAEHRNNARMMPQDTPTDEVDLHLSVDKTKGSSEPCAEPSDVPTNDTVHKISNKESKRSCEHDVQFQELTYASYDRSQQKSIAGEVKDVSNGCGEAEVSSDSDGYHSDRIDVAKKKHDFVSSQCMVLHDSETVDLTEQNLCMKCNEAGQLLVCCSNNCQLVFHEKCIGSSARFDDKGKFFCPFCTYSLVITEYLEAKKRSSLANKKLAAFIHRGSEHQPKEFSDRLNKEQHHYTGGSVDEDCLDKSHENTNLGEREENEKIQVESKVNEDNNLQCENIIVDKEQVELSASCNNNVNVECREKRMSRNRGSSHVSAGEKEGEEELVEECPSPRRFEERQNEVSKRSNNVPGENADVAVREKGEADLGVQREVLKEQDSDAPRRHVYEFNFESEENSEDGDDESVISNYYIRVRKKETNYTYPVTPRPQLRRQKVPWTAEEEQKLKEGVENFSNERNIPWKKILEFGNSVFLKGRTTVDLKDKWRNMCKGTPK